MTTLIQQKSDNDCALAAIAMAAGKERWEDLWTPEDLQKVIDSRGVSEYSPWMARAGFVEYEDYKTFYTSHYGIHMVHAFLWHRRALLSVNSLNHDYGHHAVYWDGVRVYDPQDGVEGKRAHPFLSSMIVSKAILFRE